MDMEETTARSTSLAFLSAPSSNNSMRLISPGPTITTPVSTRTPPSTSGRIPAGDQKRTSSPLYSSLRTPRRERCLSSPGSIQRWDDIYAPGLILFVFITQRACSFFIQCCSYDSMHPPSPVNMGEAWTKNVYEALRSSPQWDGMLFLITFDEHGVCRAFFWS